MHHFLKVILICSFFGSFAQEVKKDSIKIPIDSLYREDQFYFNITYNSLLNGPKGFSQNKFSPGISFGFLRDMPLNKKRTFAVAIGFGYSSSNYYGTMYIYKGSDANGNETRNYEIISQDTYYKSNKLSMQYLDIPLEIRWRNSTFESHKFWRIYSGLKVSYLISDKYKYENGLETIIINNNPDLNKIQYGIYLTAGWNTFNFYAYYGLNPIFKSGIIGNQNVKFNTLNIGLQFYIL